MVNDFAGDPDGLFALAQAVMQRSTQFTAAVGSLYAFGGPAPGSADRSKTGAQKLLKIMGFPEVPVYAGADNALVDTDAPRVSEGAEALVREANRTDTQLPLYVTCGGGLTDVASVLLMDPSIAGKFTLVWIGGSPHPSGGPEYNLDLDPDAGRVVFNQSEVPIWQVTSQAYSQCLVSFAELECALGRCGKVGPYLLNALNEFVVDLGSRLRFGDAFSLGDSPLVLLTALNAFADSAGTSQWDTIPTPRLAADLTYASRPEGRPLRNYTLIDTRLMHGDLFAPMNQRYGRRR
ncbi:hypothetical protein FHR75_004130 [Kineococcus radiotolerans]|uniref:Inosine/uridine-preferring nucleoside hydrolase domain-containing protein n=1 Tax=Kineococcus radiotolerans TaxID=131568 RepID=A0A7W4XYQ0_KINRA|nr:nucleoside hydrolase [Kineococcus radiotolerans]MBB2903288.1 hypothetical protein [Kineococcus radiotolerans]